MVLKNCSFQCAPSMHLALAVGCFEVLAKTFSSEPRTLFGRIKHLLPSPRA